jgi:phage tail-like protein
MSISPITPISLFVVKVPDIDTIGMFTSCSGLELQVDVLEYAEGGNNEFVHQLPGRLRYPNLVLSRGLTNEDAVFKWFSATKTKADLKEVTITFQTHTQQAIRTFTFADAFPVRWTGPTSEAGTANVALETLEIAHGGLKGI